MKRKAKRWTARRIHYWISIILAIPMALVAASGILISMRSVSHATVPLSWLRSETTPQQFPITAFAQTDDGAVWIGNAQGLYRVSANQTEEVSQFIGQEIIALAVRKKEDQPIVATRMAVWEKVDQQWVPVHRGRVRQLSILSDGTVFTIVGGRGEFADGKPFVSKDPRAWQSYELAQRANAQLPRLENPRVPLHQMMRELHSGAFLLGKGPGEMLWSNILGWVLLSLILTGLWMWLKMERIKADRRVEVQKHKHKPIDRNFSLSDHAGQP